MTLQETIQSHLTKSIKSGNVQKKNALRVLLGELTRGESKTKTDEEVLAIIKSSIKTQEGLGTAKDQNYIAVLEEYLPVKRASDEEVRLWIKSNIDFSQYKSPKQAMKDVMKEFSGRANGKSVEEILLSLVPSE